MASIRRHRELLLPCMVAAILAALVVPLPAWLLDLGLALNLVAAAALLVAALRAGGPLELSAFPTLLLVTTLLRLALNVSSTRLALAEGHAGAVIQAFGEFVVRGDYVVGGVVFAVVTLVQFLVVAKGAERVSEVAARFTLDAMPGKQMAIDADLRAGLIDQGVARERRRSLERESQMFGAMDGAMKFVKGDVLAGLVIVLVNLVGGVLVGMLQRGLEAQEALARYALIAIGDGLVSQVPSLCIAVAAGLVVTRVAPGEEGQGLGDDIGLQLFGSRGALYLLAGVAGALALVPGMPQLTFLGLAGALAALGHGGWPSPERAALAAEPPSIQPAPGAIQAESSETVTVSPLALELAPGWIESSAGARPFQEALRCMRAALESELGFRMPGVHVRAGAALPDGSYRILVDEVPAASGRLPTTGLLVRSAATELGFLSIEAEPVEDPLTGRPLARVPEPARERLELAGLEPRAPAEVVVEHLASVARRHAPALLGLQDVQLLLDGLEARCPALVRPVLEKVPLPVLTDVLRRLLHEGVSVRNLRGVLETLASPAVEGDPAVLTERCRQALARWISHRHAPSGALFAWLVDPALEETLRTRVIDGAPALEPERVQGLLEAVAALVEDGRAVLLASGDVRRPLRALCEGAFPEVAVLAYAELDPALRVKPLGRLSA
ncbi:MAG TPA: flagellar biosynthesis protein FlhA [Myxococcaceae bacterium]|nr:flagellar biosynthesis protein FlhA [Myxococcaceae bacterium]